jgi:tetratricopeptide (TPR) repeat protein
MGRFTRSRCGLLAVCVLMALVTGTRARAADVVSPRLLQFERAIEADPEDLKLGAEYRQAVIAAQLFDRSIDFFEKLAKRKGGGPNVEISLALAYVDKVPPAGDIRRLYLGRDAITALTRSIAQRPCVLAYYMRGVINLYYNRFIFNRTDKGVSDLVRALSMATADTPPTLIARIYTALGDGNFKLGNIARARETWTTGAEKFPDDVHLKERLAQQGQELEWAVGAALAAERRVDTSLVGLLSDR